MKRLLLIILASVLAAACGISRRAVYNGQDGSSPAPRAYTAGTYNAARVSLEQAYRDWKGTPYVLGGRSSSGVDCSAFVSLVFDDYFGIGLPMNTRRLLNSGQGVRRRSVRTGDLVFFRTGRKTFHVGIIIGDGDFIHASTSQGVTTSSLYDKYWANRYMTARRVM